MQENIRVVNKKCGQTPLDCINNLKKEDESLVDLPMTYAGRLDPLASGVLIVLIGNETHKKEQYLNLPKEYELDVLFGFATDTYDLMGIAVQPQPSNPSCPTKRSNPFMASGVVPLEKSCTATPEILSRFTGKIKQNYPPYSSRTVKGKPLFLWAREGKLDEIDIPEHDVFVESIEIIKEDFISGGKLLEKIKNDIGKVKGDFRQKEIIDLWEDILKNRKEEKYKTIKLKISCGSGAYMRVIANDLGFALGTQALALNIIRTKVGDYRI